MGSPDQAAGGPFGSFEEAQQEGGERPRKGKEAACGERMEPRHRSRTDLAIRALLLQAEPGAGVGRQVKSRKAGEDRKGRMQGTDAPEAEAEREQTEKTGHEADEQGPLCPPSALRGSPRDRHSRAFRISAGKPEVKVFGRTWLECPSRLSLREPSPEGKGHHSRQRQTRDQGTDQSQPWNYDQVARRLQREKPMEKEGVAGQNGRERPKQPTRDPF